MINGTTLHVPPVISTVTAIVKTWVNEVVEDVFATVSSKAEVWKGYG